MSRHAALSHRDADGLADLRRAFLEAGRARDLWQWKRLCWWEVQDFGGVAT